jgi:hypothetical protein
MMEDGLIDADYRLTNQNKQPKRTMKRKTQTRKKYSDTSQYNPEIHNKTKGGLGFGMKKGIKSELWESSGGQLADVFGWTLPPHIQAIKDAYYRNKRKKK